MKSSEIRELTDIELQERLESEENKGSIFRLSVPLKAVAGAPVMESIMPSETFGLRDLDGMGPEADGKSEAGDKAGKEPVESRLLMVEDELNPLKELLDMMEGFGIPLDRAKNVHEGQDAIRHRRYSLVFMTVNLFSLGDVAEVLQLRTDLGFGDMPIIGLLDQPTSEEEKILLSMGLNRCMAGPYDEETMRGVVREFVPDEESAGEAEEKREPEEGLIQANPLGELESEPTLQD